MNFSLEQLSSFVTVYELKAFSKAAVKLNKHRTTVGQMINGLEDQLAVTLFERVGRSVEPTKDADFLYLYAKQALEQAKVFDKVALSLSFGGLESITIAYPSLLQHKVVSEIRKKLFMDYPNMKVSLLIRNKSEIKAGLQDGSIHFGIVNTQESRLMNSIDFTFIGNLAFAPFAKIGSKLAELPANKTFPKMKSTHQFILKSMVDDDMKDRIILSAAHEYIDQLSLIVSLVQEDLGWALLPKGILDDGYEKHDLVEIKCDQIRRSIKVPIALWSADSIQIVDIKKTIVAVLDLYAERVIGGGNNM